MGLSKSRLAFDSNNIRAAVLNVFAREPLPESSLLFVGMDNVFITAHSATVSFSEEVVQIFM